ncbi:hypothetical protein WJX84_009119 [Apatococcus fuscideae]|uniref:Uncharacterized protein n=1 Tax=Apatococcus fuscideae TaxID=2026836 RepID=A0AAW1SAA0_9CHLO
MPNDARLQAVNSLPLISTPQASAAIHLKRPRRSCCTDRLRREPTLMMSLGAFLLFLPRHRRAGLLDMYMPSID